MSRVDLLATGGLDVDSVRKSLVSHTVTGSDEVRSSDGEVTHRRVLNLRGGPAAVVLHITVQGVSVRLEDEASSDSTFRDEASSDSTFRDEASSDSTFRDEALSDPAFRDDVSLDDPSGELREAADVVSWWFDLDTDPGDITVHLEEDPWLRSLIAQRPALRPLRHPEGFEAAICTVLGQQVTLAAGRLFAARLTGAYSPAATRTEGRRSRSRASRGLPSWRGTSQPLAVFPTPDALAAASLDELRAVVGLTTSRAVTVQAVARLFADGFRLDRTTDRRTARQQLMALPGVGPWTVEYLALRALGDPDAFPASDAVVRRALGGLDSRAATEAAEAWRPYRSWATAHLWAGAT